MYKVRFDPDGGIAVNSRFLLAFEAQFDRLLVSYGMRRSGIDRIKDAYAQVRQFDEVTDPAATFEDRLASWVLGGRDPKQLLGSIHTCWEVGTCMYGLHDEAYDQVAERLSLVISGALPRRGRADQPSPGRDALFELNMLAELKRAGISARLGDVNPDILVHFPGQDYYLECKRVSSTSTKSIQRNLHNASKQIDSNMPEGLYGVIALGIGDHLIEQEVLLRTEHSGVANEVLASLDDFVEKTLRIIRNPGVVSNRVAGILFYSSVLEHASEDWIPKQSILCMFSDATFHQNSGEMFARFFQDFSKIQEDVDVDPRLMYVT